MNPTVFLTKLDETATIEDLVKVT